MGFFDRLFGRKDAPPGAPDQPRRKARRLMLEGSEIPLYTVEARFLTQCGKTGLAAMVVPFTEFWAVYGRGMQAKALTGGARLLCSSCLVDMATSFRFSLPGGLGSSFGGIVAVGANLPGNLFDAAKAARCPYCGSTTGILLSDRPDYGEITAEDLDALRALWHARCGLWWQQNQRDSGICDRCNARLARGEGYHRESEIICEACVPKSTDAKPLESLRKDPDYFGVSELRRARNFAAGKWRFARASISEAA